MGGDVGFMAAADIFTLRPDVEYEIRKHREWLSYILCLADGGPKWSDSKLESISRQNNDLQLSARM